MRATVEPTTRQAITVGVFDRVEGLRSCLDALRTDGVPLDGLTVLAHEHLAPGAPSVNGEPSTALAHEALIGGVLRDYLPSWGGLALVTLKDLGPAMVAGGARAMVAERLAAVLAEAPPTDPERANLLAALRQGSWLLIAHGDEELLAAAGGCLGRSEASWVTQLIA